MREPKTNGVTGAVTRGAVGAAGETLKRTGSAARKATGAVPDVTGTGAVEDVGEQVMTAAEAAERATEAAGSAVEAAGGAVEAAGGAVERAVDGGGQRSVREELRAIVRETALEVLVPVARSATKQAAKYAITRGPDLARNTIAPKLGAAIEGAGGPAALGKGALSSVTSAGSAVLENVRSGAEAPSRPWRERRLPVEESIDVVVPLDTAYERFTKFEEYANVMSRGEIVDERPNERIEWERTDGVDDTAVITFHRLSDRLSRVMVTYDHESQGLVERTRSLLRSLPHALNADLMRFKAFAEMTGEQKETNGRKEMD